MYLSLMESQKSQELCIHGDLGLLDPLGQVLLSLVCCLRHLVQAVESLLAPDATYFSRRVEIA